MGMKEVGDQTEGWWVGVLDGNDVMAEGQQSGPPKTKFGKIHEKYSKEVIHNTNESELVVKIRGEQGLSIEPTIKEIGLRASEICPNKI